MFIEYFVDDMDYYKKLFCDVLGFSVDRDDGTFVQLTRGNDKILLDGEAKSQKPDYHFYNKIDKNTNGIGIESCFVVDDLDETYTKAKNFPGLKLTPIKHKSWGVRDFRIVVPDNYYLRITEMIN
ncbi:MAG: hypothetical protein QG553_211 [Patescibacteria group bacterium]|nr:hypothetical protein [Patescibacteria group bacterium]